MLDIPAFLISYLKTFVIHMLVNKYLSTDQKQVSLKCLLSVQQQQQQHQQLQQQQQRLH